MKNSFKELTMEELQQKKAELSKKLREIRFEMVMGHLENPMQKRVLSRSIARVNTLIHQKKAAAEAQG